MSTAEKTGTPKEIGTMGKHEASTRFPPSVVRESLQTNNAKSKTVSHDNILQNPCETRANTGIAPGRQSR